MNFGQHHFSWQPLLEQDASSHLILGVAEVEAAANQAAACFLAISPVLVPLLATVPTTRTESAMPEQSPTDLVAAIATLSQQLLQQSAVLRHDLDNPPSGFPLPFSYLIIPLSKITSVQQVLEICQTMLKMPLTPPVRLSAQPPQADVTWEAFGYEQTQTLLAVSHQQLVTLVDSLPGIVFCCQNDPEWSMTYLSEGCYALTGYHPEELAGTRRLITYNEITHPDDLPALLATIHRAVEQQQPYVVEYRIRTKTGEERWFWEKGRAIYDRDGNVLRLEGFITDITERKQVEAALVASEARLQAFLNNIPAIAYIKDLEGRFIFANRELANIFQLPLEQLPGTSSYKLVTPEVAALIQDHDQQVLQTQAVSRFDEAITLPDGVHIYLSTKFPLFDPNGHLYALGGISVDISDRQRAEAALRQSEQRYQNLYDYAPDFYCSLSPAGIILSVNHHGANTLGYTKAELIGSSIYDLIDPSDRAWVKIETERIFAEQTISNRLEYRQVRKDGQVVWVSEQAQLSFNERNSQPELHVICRDITEYRQAQQALQQAEAKFRSIFENAVEGIFQTTIDGRYVTANPMLARIYGYDSPEELIASVTDIQHQLYVDPERRQMFTQLVLEQGAAWGFESQVYRKDGRIIWIAENARVIRDDAGTILGFEGTVEDITTRKQAETALRQRDNLLEGVAEATQHLLMETDFDVAIARALAALGEAARVDRVYIYENHPHQPTGEPAMSMRYEWVRESIQPSITQPHWQNQPYSAYGMMRWYQRLAAGKSLSGITKEFPAAERAILELDNIQSILMVPILIDGHFWGYIGFNECDCDRHWTKNEKSILIAMAASISGAIKRQEAEATIRYQAFHDLLTNLPNRTLFNDRLQVALANAQRSESLLAILFLDLDRFKTINDTLGHTAGDQLLRAVAQRLANCIREGDTVSRWGGDEFTLLLPQINSAEDAAKAAQRIIDALRPAFFLEDHELYISSSIGIALYPADGCDPQALLKNADAALYRVKEQGRNGFQFYTPAMNSRASELLVLENSLHHALIRQQFELHFQPQVNIVTQRITRMEALLRWHHPELGLISPNVFIAIAEENGLIIPIGQWVLQTACQQYVQWQTKGIAPQRIAVNLSARQFRQQDLLDTITQTLEKTQLAPSCLELEITETTAMKNVDYTRSTLHKLREMGIHISIDDFGTGYSSLSYLKKFPLDTIKIDRSFVQELTVDPNDAAIVSAVIALGKGLNLSVVAEGVETTGQLDHLRSLQCYEMQGYLFSRPLVAAAATALLQTNQLPAI